VVNLDQRLDALEKQVADLVRQSEENGNRLRNVESGIGQMKTDQDQRIAALEQKMSEASVAAPAVAPAEAVPATTAPAKAKTPSKVPPKKTADAQPSAGEGGHTARRGGWEKGQNETLANESIAPREWQPAIIWRSRIAVSLDESLR